MDQRNILVAALRRIIAKQSKPMAEDILLQLGDECSDPYSDYWKELWENEDYLREDFKTIEDLAYSNDALEDCLDMLGDTGYFFEDGVALAPTTLLAHFTKAPPLEILTKGFIGANLDHLGLTKGGGKRLAGDYALAYDLKDLTEESLKYIKYGGNVILFKAGVAVKAYHKGDDEYQVIFDVRTVKKPSMLGFENSGNKYEVFNNKGQSIGTRPAVLKSLKLK